MTRVLLGKTGILTDKNGFGALPIQRVSFEAAAHLLLKALDGGITFFDTARSYSDSEEKIGRALKHRRSEYILATKTPSQTADGFWRDLETSLQLLQTDYVDLLQFHNPSFCPKPGDGTGLYEAMLEAKAQGKIRFIGLTNHRLPIAREAVLSGLYDTLQFPFSYLASEEDQALVRLCAQKNVGFIAMKALSGGLITNATAAYAYLAKYENALPIWGVQHESELDQFLRFVHEPPAMTPALEALIEADKKELAGNFCRGCGYCEPCPAQIDIKTSARMSLLLRRAPAAAYLTPTWQEKMRRVEDCLHCGRCAERCPYGLDTPELLHRNYEDYKTFLAPQD